jgi:hypothetical protein
VHCSRLVIAASTAWLSTSYSLASSSRKLSQFLQIPFGQVGRHRILQRRLIAKGPDQPDSPQSPVPKGFITFEHEILLE